jgi:TPR repeat protein
MFKGLPPEIALSAGFRVRDDAWAVSVNDAPNLAMSSPAGYQGSYQLAVTLHRGREANPETRVISVRLGTATADGTAATPPHARPTATTVSRDVEPVSEVASIPAKTELSEGEETALLQSAAAMLKNGDIEAARLAYSELATHGSGEAAYLMAQTYDPRELEKYFVVGMQPDPELARQWYGRAVELGYREAKERLTTLNAK